MKIEKITRDDTVEELHYLLTVIDDMEDMEAYKEIAKLNDYEIIEKLNQYYDGTGTKFDMIKVK